MAGILARLPVAITGPNGLEYNGNLDVVRRAFRQEYGIITIFPSRLGSSSRLWSV